jgi:alpha-beta hydrolase superfamily lysophospholipase/SAM-dependent methyltransferase
MKKWTIKDGFFKSWDGTELFYRTWKPKLESKKALIVIHRGHEHSGRVAQLVEDLDINDFWAFSWDSRGHGNSPGERGHADSYYHLVKDLDSFINFISQAYSIPIENMAIVANSVGAVTASTWVHDFSPRIRAMVLAAPAFRIKLYIPFALPLLRLFQKFRKKAVISSYVKPRMLTHDSEQAKLYEQDKLITKNIAVNVLLGLHDTSTRILNDAEAISTPTLILSAGSDWVVKNSAQQKFYKKLSSPIAQMESYAGFFHALLYEKDRQRPIAKTRKFILDAFEIDIDKSSLIKADQGNFTRKEYDLLRQAPSFLKGLEFGFLKLALKTLGRLSKGIGLGWKTGFDSGQSLDYVYENHAHGTAYIGKIIDRVYLNSVGWRGIRERGANLEKSLKEVIGNINKPGKPIQILDIACGCGRYVLNVINENNNGQINATLSDRDPDNLKVGRKIAESMGLERIEFKEGDAFNEDSIKSTRLRPDIVIVSGLYELFPDNELILKSLRGIFETIRPGGYLIYTCQPWHPQVELIARSLSNRNGNPWVMRRRSQAEMDELVSSTGFKRINLSIDSFGIFTVSVAQKVEAL